MTAFRPGLVPTLVVAMLLPMLVLLGFWQLQRAEQKRQLLDTYAQHRNAAPLSVEQLLSSPEPAFRRVHLRGHLDAQHSLLLDNRIRDGKVGVELLQPFQDLASGQWLLLNRGWIEWPSRRTPPVFSTPDQLLELEGWVYASPGAPFQLHADPTQAHWPRLITAVFPARLWAELGRSGSAEEIRIQPGPVAYQADWSVIATGMGPEKHTAYAVQWFAMALALCGLYLYLGWHNAQEKRHGNGHQSA
ncbi:SURF1 family protein [Pseudomonas weihenstephanensis]|uniref:SURF1 family protein n=1 Tax=Pseudomonas weihenstephanensis TaxID=1608994 RepID=UPI00065457E2|nr:SURF1 family protein [Pseudomonas weihenstephanensis]KMN17416.1 cytochrome oxidase biogenesis protein Surf1,facilitates heme A insertion [Pseudomonas weihenstephanensis]MBM1191125.1 SURF1 family protein [Pseudomonas weihenstephanensis]